MKLRWDDLWVTQSLGQNGQAAEIDGLDDGNTKELVHGSGDHHVTLLCLFEIRFEILKIAEVLYDVSEPGSSFLEYGWLVFEGFSTDYKLECIPIIF